MHDSILTRGATTLGAVLLLTLGLLAYAAGAQAAPGTVTGPNDLTMTVDDTTPAPGQTITLNWSVTTDASAAGRSDARMGFGGNDFGGLAVNANQLSFVSCGGQFSNCGFNPAFFVPFAGDLPVTALGDVTTGTARFTVSSSATNGLVISFYGIYRSGARRISTDDPLELTVTTNADLGVSLSASASLLNPRVTYDAAVTNHGPDAATSATVVTQLPSQVTGVASSTCTYASSTDQVSCSIGALANGATTHATFTATYGLLSIGFALDATATRTASSPTDPNASNDSDRADCAAISSLLIGC